MSKRGGFPGMGGFGGMNINQLMKEAKKMQADLEKSQEELGSKEFNATAGGGAIEVIVSGDKKLKNVKFKNMEKFDVEDLDILEDMIKIAFNDAISKIERDVESKLGVYGKQLGGLI